MVFHFPEAANLYSSSLLASTSRVATFPFIKPPQRTKSPRFSIKSAKRSVTSKTHQKDSKRTLSRILRTEAAVRGIVKKADSTKYVSLWPKSVLEALEDSIRSNQWESALKIFELLRKQHWYQPRCETYTKLLMMLGKCKQPDQASFLFEKMMSESLEPTVDVYTSLVRAYGLSGFLDEAFRTVTEMNSLSDCRPDVYTYSTLLHCCIKLCRFDLIDHVLDNMSNSGIECNTVTYNTIIDGYGKAGMFELMESSLTEMIETGSCLPDVFTLNTFTWAYGNAGDIDKMERWYDEFQHMGVKPDIKTFNILIRSYGKTGMCDKIGLVMEFMGKRFYSPNVVTFNTVIEMFGKAGNIERMEYFFRTMKYRGVKPNYVTYCSLVSGYSKAGHVKKVGSILRQVENSDVVLDTPYFNCVINAYGQAGELKLMEDMFVEMKERDCKPDDITFSIMIQAYKSQGMVGAAQELEIHLLGRKGNPGLTCMPNTVEGGNSISSMWLLADSEYQAPCLTGCSLARAEKH